MSIRIYTKTGDKGKTSLLGGEKVSKSSIRIDAYGDVDELSAFIGLLKDKIQEHKTIGQELFWIQDRLFCIGSILAAKPGFSGFELPSINGQDTHRLEISIDKWTEELPELKNFLLAGGHEVVSLCHVCRTVCRRAERAINQLDSEEQVEPEILVFINRLSDYFFVLSRKLAQMLQVEETAWIPGS